jgi:protein phosphatase
MVVYGHTPVPEASWLNRTICIDTGCVFGGRLTTLRYPERELVSVPARQTYWQPARPLGLAPSADGVRGPTDLDLDDVVGKRIIATRLGQTVTIREENAIAALEVMSRFAADPRWLVYLPPTMAPTATSGRPGLLEHPAEAFTSFRGDGVERVICEEKHMGSRAVVVVCRDSSVASRRFAIDGSEGAGVVVTRTGRPFFRSPGAEAQILAKVRGGLDAARLWEELDTDWLVLDCELLPWSAKAEDLLRRQYASVGAAATATLAAEVAVLSAASRRGGAVAAVGDLLARSQDRAAMAAGFVDAYRRYCWPVDSIDDLRLAPFQILAGEGKVHALTDHHWHLQVLDRGCPEPCGS